jgi:glyoxylase-like metal-dependent hydrolase (beta-lactamase superfamily II)
MNNDKIKTRITVFCFNPFQENTYVISHLASGDCWIIDPGCYTRQEETRLFDYIESHTLKPVKLLNTHCHLDHIYGNKAVADKYGLTLGTHEKELPVLHGTAVGARMFGAKIPDPLEPAYFISEGDVLMLGDVSFDVLFTPGHSPGSICFLNKEEQYAIVGDVLFNGSIGRTDLPGGDHDKLLRSIRTQLYVLPDETEIYNGHGPFTTVGQEKRTNPFVRG